jgi:hypothetical protein
LPEISAVRAALVAALGLEGDGVGAELGAMVVAEVTFQTYYFFKGMSFLSLMQGAITTFSRLSSLSHLAKQQESKRFTD